jgi:glutathione S-transferase
MMKLIGSLTSPYVRKARVVLAEKKIDAEFAIDSPWLPDSGVPNTNPLGKIPVLLLDDGTALFDSRVIVEYLDHMSPNNRLLPTTNRERIAVKRLEALADGICDAAATIFLERKRPEERQSPEWIVRQHGKIVAGLRFMADELGDESWFMGTPYSLADIACGCALGYIAFRFPEIDWRADHPNLGRLFDKLQHRAAFADTTPHD